MLPAMETFKKALRKVEIEDPVIAVHSNIHGRRYNNAEEIRRQLPNQVFFYYLIFIN